MAAPHLTPPAAPIQQLPTELAQRLRQAVADPVATAVGHDHRLLHEIVQCGDDVRFVDAPVTQHRPRRLGVEASGEHRRPFEHRARTIIEQVVRPGHGCPQRLLSSRARTAAQQPEAVVQTLEDVGQRRGSDAPGGELDRQRDPVEPATDRLDRGTIGLRHRHRVVNRLGPLTEELEGVARAHRHHGHDPLAGQPERFSTRRQDRRRRGSGLHGGDDVRHARSEVLAVVQDQQRRRPRRQAGNDGVDAGGLQPCSDGRRHDTDDGFRRGDGCEVDEPHPTWEPGGVEQTGLDRQPRLADPARSDQRREARRREITCPLSKVIGRSDPRRHRRPHVSEHARSGPGQRDAHVVRAQPTLERPELRPRFEADLDERGPGPLERSQGVRVPAASVQREHQQPPTTLTERFVDDHRLERRHPLTVSAERQRDLRQRLTCLAELLHEVLGVAVRGWMIREVHQWWTSPQPARHLEHRGCFVSVTGDEADAALAPRSLEPVEIGGVRIDAQHVARRSRLDHVGPEQLPEPEHQVLHDLRLRSWCTVTPHGLGQPVDAHHLTHRHHHRHEDRTLASAPHHDEPVGPRDLKRSEDRERQRGRMLGLVPRNDVGVASTGAKRVGCEVGRRSATGDRDWSVRHTWRVSHRATTSRWRWSATPRAGRRPTVRRGRTAPRRRRRPGRRPASGRSGCVA